MSRLNDSRFKGVALLLAAVLLVGVLLLAGCAPQEEEEEAAQEEEAQVERDTLTIAIGAEPESLDPVRMTSAPAATVGEHVVERPGVDRRFVVTTPHAYRSMIVQEVDHPFELASSLLVECR